MQEHQRHFHVKLNWNPPASLVVSSQCGMANKLESTHVFHMLDPVRQLCGLAIPPSLTIL